MYTFVLFATGGLGTVVDWGGKGYRQLDVLLVEDNGEGVRG